jgi:hypothetical protein
MRRLALLALLACAEDPAVDAPVVVPETETPTGPAFEAPPAAMHRLTAEQYRRAVHDLFGVHFEGALPEDYVLHGYTAVGAGTLSVSASEFERYESAAWEVAAAVVDGAPEALLGCTTHDCARAWFAEVSRRAWRHPAESDDLDDFLAVYDDLRTRTDAATATEALVAGLLLSPRFLYHLEVGTTGPGGHRVLTSWERAGRLALFLRGSVPDAALVDAADAGALDTVDGVRAEAERLLATPRAREVLGAWFAETLELERLDRLDKDPSIGVLTDGLRTEMRDELTLLFDEVVFDRGDDFRSLLTTDVTFAGPELAALYGLPDVPGLQRTVLPAEEGRGGILGRAGWLAVRSHAAQTSPTRRGKYVWTRLLCRNLALPPEGVVTSLEGISADASLRDRLELHMTEPLCRGCHGAVDPLGFAFESYDALGAWRPDDDGYAIDATGDLDGVSFDGAAQLARLVADHADTSRCMVRQLYRHATGQYESAAADAAIAELDGAWADGHDLLDLVVALVAHDGFVTAAPPLGGACAEADEGQTRSCVADCGIGTETCVDGTWRGCDAISGADEVCNGRDDDCDGNVDDGLERACETAEGPSTQVCDDGRWLSCGEVP